MPDPGLSSVTRVSGPGLQNSDSADYQTGGKEDCQKQAVFALGGLGITPGDVSLVFSLTTTNHDADITVAMKEETLTHLLSTHLAIF